MLNSAQTSPALALDVGCFGRACSGERVSGDATVVARRGDALFLAVIDVLGHGPEAHEVAKRAQQHLRAAWGEDVAATLRGLHQALKGSRGAAAGLCVLDCDSGELCYTGVGNTVIRRFGPQPARLTSADGIVGAHIRKPTVQTLSVCPADVLLLYTDGITDRFEFGDYPQLRYHGAKVIAENVVDRFRKTYDDATCVAVRHRK